MIQFKRNIALAAVAFGLAMNVAAQSAAGRRDYRPAPYVFIGMQGGGQTTFTDYDAKSLITPTASLSLGVMATPAVGLRLHANGIWNRGGIKPSLEYDYRYLTGDLDIMLNLCTLFGKYNRYALNLYLIGGGGANYAWQNDDLQASTLTPDGAWTDHHWSHNIRVGTMLDWNLGKHVSLNLEVSGNFLDDRYNSKVDRKDDIQLTAQLGLMFKFGYRKAAKDDDVEIVPAAPTRPRTRETASVPATPVQPQRGVTPKPAATATVVPELRQDIFFALNSTVPTGEEADKVDVLVQFLQAHSDARVALTGYADAGTGTPDVNQRVARKRAENVRKALCDRGIDDSRITVDVKGSDEQPFTQNDRNRVVIAVARK